MDKQEFLQLVDRLNGIIDQAKFIRNILVHNEHAETQHVRRYIVELKDMVNNIPK